MGEFKDRYGPVALVTGASSGIGRGFAEELAERGLDLVITARRKERLEELAARLRAQHGVTVDVVVADLADPAAPQALADATQGHDVGLVVSNAGFSVRGFHETLDPAELTEARDLYERCLLLDGDDVRATTNLGFLLLDHGAPTQGRALLNEALALGVDKTTATAIRTKLESASTP